MDSMEGKFCDKSYFGVSQEVIATMVISGVVKKGGPPPPPFPATEDTEILAGVYRRHDNPVGSHSTFATASCLTLGLIAAVVLAAPRLWRKAGKYEPAKAA